MDFPFVFGVGFELKALALSKGEEMLKIYIFTYF